MNRRLFTILVVAVVLGVIIWYYYPRPAGEGSGEPIAEVVVPQLDAMSNDGKAAFDQNCASCHGANAAGQVGVAPPLVHKIYEPGHHGDQAFYLAAKQGVRAHHWPFGDMPPVEGITDDEISKIINYVRTLQRANGIY